MVVATNSLNLQLDCDGAVRAHFDLYLSLAGVPHLYHHYSHQQFIYFSCLTRVVRYDIDARAQVSVTSNDALINGAKGEQ